MEISVFRGQVAETCSKKLLYLFAHLMTKVQSNGRFNKSLLRIIIRQLHVSSVIHVTITEQIHL